MNEINFAGLKGRIIESSPHSNYLVVQLSNRISITGTYSNQFNWSESRESESGFISFLVYVGFNTNNIQQKYLNLIAEMGGYCRDGEDKRKKKRVQGKFRFEMKIRGLAVSNVLELMNI